MKIYRERETDHHFIFEVRPYQFFDLSSSSEHELNPNRKEASIIAFNAETQRMEEFAIAKSKKLGHEVSRALVDRLPDEIGE